MSVYDYTPQTYRFTGGTVINDLKGSKQEGCLLHFRRKTDDKEFTIFINKRDLAHIDWLFHAGRRWWKRFRLPKMRRG